MNNFFSPYKSGGADRVLELQARGLISRGYEIFIVAAKPIGAKVIEEDKYKVYRINSFYFLFSKLPKFLRLMWHIIEIFDLWAYLRVSKILKMEKPDIAITHNLIGIGFIVSRLFKKRNIRHIHYLHDVQLLHPSGLIIKGKENITNTISAKIYQTVNKFLFKDTDIAVSPSRWLLALHHKNNFFKRSKQLHILNPFELMIEDESGEKNGDIEILYVGNIDNYKGVDILLEALGRVRKELNKKIILNLAGKIINNDLPRKYKHEDNRFHGFISRDNIRELFKKSRLLVLPSICYENSPSVIYEALGMKTLVVGSRLGGIEELVHQFGGILFEPGNESDLGRKLIWALKNPAQINNIVNAGYRKIKDYGLDEYIKNIELLIKNS